MSSYTQAERPLEITTPLGKDVLLLTGFRGHEAISRLFSFQLDLLADADEKIRFDRILGQSATVAMRLPGDGLRYFNGIVKRFSQGVRDRSFVRFRAQLAPRLWLLKKRVQSRIFQHLSVPEILHQVFSGLDARYELAGAYHPRDYCVQYRESDFHFASRLMEEEGIYYFFEHEADVHRLVVTDTAGKHPNIPGPGTITYDEMSGGVRDDMRITTWKKTQELRSGALTLWDHCFELPGNPLEAREKTIESVAVGKVIHKLGLGGNDRLEIYDYPGGYAQRFDGVDRSGVPRPQDLQSIFQDRERTVRIRMEQEEARSLAIEGGGDCGHFTAGHKFALEGHFDADGEYLLTRIAHQARTGDYRSGQERTFRYENRFACIPDALRYRPRRVTRKPVIAGIQTATVVGPRGEEIFCDPYGRVKVQFHWDREGKKDANSSCWLRVAQVWAGKGWGAFFWPRAGNEVVVTFEEGDPDQPVIIGSVYNAENRPPYLLPNLNTFSGFKSASERGQHHENFNGILFVDEKDHEHLSIHSERHMVFTAEFDKQFRAGRHQGERVAGARLVTVGRLPGGGGSGGGPSKLWPQPEPVGVLGLNATAVYGGNFQIATPINVQLALGSNLQICVNPAAMASAFSGEEGLTAPASPVLAEVLGSGLGGNMQFTLGTSANFVMGQVYDINLGPRRIVIDAHGTSKRSASPIHKTTILLAKVIEGVVAVFVVVYALLHDDDQRAALLITFQLVMQVLLMAIMEFQTLYDIQETNGNDEYRKAFVDEPPQNREGKPTFLDTGWAAIAGVGAVLGVAQLPLVLDSIGEKQLHDGPDPEPGNQKPPQNQATHYPY